MLESVIASCCTVKPDGTPYMLIPHRLQGIVAMVLAMGLFISGDALMKLALARMPLFELALIRGYASIVFCLILTVVMGHARDLHQVLNPWLLARGLCEVVANVGFTIAIFRLPLADVTAIAQTCPLLVLLGARLIWGERLGSMRLFLIGLGLTGAILVAQPGSSAASPFALLGFLVAISAAIRDLITRRVPASVPAPIAALAVLLTLTVSSAIGMLVFEEPVMPDPYSVSLMILAALLVVGGHVGIFLAYKIGPARSVAPFMYSVTVWAVLLGIVIFKDIPNLLAFAGMSLVLLSGLLIIYLDGRKTVAA